ncbi:hypothetical protein FE257_004282 [Aspergillus nanangensis]|uniref:Uncharacterized protein n=1 Tax=Aspergillus nanangensis TaxID=2582783 RepID=A0AAD4CRW1_ASPNN|nr:hypothetical protein FE257_004282 [Aspergillus nanangensis]
MALLNVTYPRPDTTHYLNSEIGKMFTLDVSIYTNPFNISGDGFDQALTDCQETDGRVVTNRGTVAITCGTVFGPPRKRDGIPAWLFNNRDQLMAPIYTCASTTRAILKRANFTYNGTGQLADLSITRIEDKIYDPDEAKPVWGVEITGLAASEANPIWGFIRPSDQNRTDIISLRNDSLRLPGFQAHIMNGHSHLQNLPGVDFHIAAMKMAYDIGLLLSRNAEGAAKILNLVWTDSAANAVIGTNGWHHQRAGEDSSGDKYGGILVRKFNHTIRYRWLYGIAAFLLLFLTFLVTVATLLFFVLGRGTPSSVRWYLNATSMGRVYGQFMCPDAAMVQLLTAEWVRQVGVTKVSVGGVAGFSKASSLLTARLSLCGPDGAQTGPANKDLTVEMLDLGAPRQCDQQGRGRSGHCTEPLITSHFFPSKQSFYYNQQRLTCSTLASSSLVGLRVFSFGELALLSQNESGSESETTKSRSSLSSLSSDETTVLDAE